MPLKVLACDLDGTLTESHNVPGEMWLSLRHAKDAGLALILVTGRTMDLIDLRGPIGEIFEAIVAEDGAVVCLPRSDSVLLPFGRVDGSVLDRLEEQGVPLVRGMAIAATRVPHDREVLEAVGATGGSFSVEYNKGAVMVLPPGATKGTGLQFALNELGYSARSLLAVGDAENDRSMFELAEVSVAVASATAEIRKMADCVLPFANGKGVRSLIRTLTTGRPLPRCERRSRLLRLGKTSQGEPVLIEPRALVDANLGVVGASGTGKSWISGMLAELLLGRGYQICIIDPEGDYRGLRAFPHTLMLGGRESRLPAVADVVTMCEYNSLSLVLDMSSETQQYRPEYVTELLHGLLNLRARYGRPHWILIDEAHAFCHPAAGSLLDLIRSGMTEGGFCLVSYGPSRLAEVILEQLDHWLLTGLKLSSEVEAVRRHLADPTCFTSETAEHLAANVGRSALCYGKTTRLPVPTRGVNEFVTERRVVPHVRHLQKYLRAPLPQGKRFYFRSPVDGEVVGQAASLWEFRNALREMPIDSLRHHLIRADYERWLGAVLRDEELARQIAKLANRSLDDDSLRDALFVTVANRYEQLEALT